jgi:uncharacterized protein
MKSGLMLLIPTLLASASAQSPIPPPSVRATGEAVITVKPDEAKLDIGVVTQATTAEAAASQNATQSRAVLDKLRGVLGPKADIRTISYSVNPNYQYPREGGKPTINGYTATNTVEITTDNLAEVGKVIDAATQGGANQVQRLQYGLHDEKPARAQALRLAAIEARSNAEAMAAALGLKAGKVILLEQGTPEVIRPRMTAMAAQVAAPTPVEAGTIEIHASVTVTVLLE